MQKVFAPNHFYGIKVAGSRRMMLLYFKQRNGGEIVFKTREGDLYTGKVLANEHTGEEVCFVHINGVKHMVEAKTGCGCGQRVTQEDLDKGVVDKEWDEERQCFVKTPDTGMTLREFLAKKAELAKK
jgi:hypothetical protein